MISLTFLGRRSSEILVPSSIEVEVISSAQFEAATRTVQGLSPSAPEVQSASPNAVSPSESGSQAPLITATSLRAGRILTDPGHVVFRRDLASLDPYERVTQLCNVEAAEQILLAIPGSKIDTVSASSFAETSLEGHVFEATGAAYRADRKWYHLSFICTVRADLEAVSEFAFSLGGLVPESEWEEHNLIAEDLEDDD